MEKLRAEIASTCGSNSDFSREDLKRMAYLQNILKESTNSQMGVPSMSPR